MTAIDAMSATPATAPCRDEVWPLERLRANPRNSKRHPPDQIEQLRASLRTFGWTMPMLADEDGGLIAGHGRLEAALAEGYTEGPVRIAVGWSDEMKRAYMIADNKLTENGEWDDEMLIAELRELSELGVDLALTGFANDELAELLDVRDSGLTDPEATPPVPETPVTRPGDRYILGRHVLMCGSATSADDVRRLLGSARPHLMVTDPPYGVEYDPAWRNDRGLNNDVQRGLVHNDDNADWQAAWDLFDGDVAYVWHASLKSPVVAASLERAGLLLRAQIIWNKSVIVIGRGDYQWKHEPCWYAVRKGKTGHYNGDRTQATVWDIEKPRAQDTGHSTQKPVECMRRPMVNNSLAGDAVYDPFCGSGTSIIAAEMSGRRCYAMELSPAYVDVAVKRWEEFTGERVHLDRASETRQDALQDAQP